MSGLFSVNVVSMLQMSVWPLACRNLNDKSGRNSRVQARIGFDTSLITLFSPPGVIGQATSDSCTIVLPAAPAEAALYGRYQ